MDNDDFADAFLDREYLKLDEGSLAFIFSRKRLDAALALSPDDALALLKQNHAEMVALYRSTTRRILKEAFYIDMFEELSRMNDDMAFAFINFALGRIEDADVEKARVDEVKAYQNKLKKK